MTRHINHAAVEAAQSTIPLSVVRATWPALARNAQEELAAEISYRCCDAVLRGFYDSRRIPLNVWLRGYARRIAANRDITAMAARLNAASVDEHGPIRAPWTPSDPGWADDDEVDQAIESWDAMPRRWRNCVHGQAVVLAEGLGIPHPHPVWRELDRARLVRELEDNPIFAMDDLVAHAEGRDCDPALAGVWRSLGQQGQQALRLAGVTRASRAVAANTVALDAVTGWLRPHNRALATFRSQVCSTSWEDRDVLSDAADAWIEAVFAPVAVHDTTGRPSGSGTSAEAAFARVADLHSHPLGDHPDMVAANLARAACADPCRLHRYGSNRNQIYKLDARPGAH